MQLNARNFVRALLPAAIIALCNGCGGGGSGGTSAVSSNSSPPPAAAVPAPTPAPTPTPTPATGNAAPAIGGTAGASAMVGATYQFQPEVSDPEGDMLTFTAGNLPPWASVDPVSGRISGTPGPGDIGQYEAITVTVADASHQSSIAPFTITVTGAVSAGGAAVTWQSPPSKVDGSPLDDLAGYRIVFGRTAEDLDNSIYIEDPNATSYQFSTLEGGVWYFAVVAVNASGLEGTPSTAVMKSI